MHISITNQETGVTSTICIDRNNGHAEIIHAEPEHVRTLLQIAAAIGVDSVLVTCSDSGLWQANGFKETGLRVMVYDTK